MLWQFFSLPGIKNGIEYRYFSRYRIEVRNSSIVTTLVPPDLPKRVYVRANHSWSSFTDRSLRFFNESLWIAFPNNVLVSKFRS